MAEKRLKPKPDYDKSTMWMEVRKIIANSSSASLFSYTGILHTKKEDIGVWDINPIEIERNYLDAVGDTLKIRFKVPLGDYVNRIYPFRSNLEFTMRRRPIRDASKKVKKVTAISVTRYKVVFNPANNPPVGASDVQARSIKDLNSVDMVEVQVELLNRSLEPLRIKTTDGVFQNAKPGTFLAATLGAEATKVRVDGKPCIDALNIVPPDNLEIIPHILVPAGTRVVNLATFLQTEIGLYNRGVGTFFQIFRGKRTLFIYPLYDTERFNGSEPRVAFYAVPQEKLPQLDRSYHQDGDILKVAVTAQRRYTDSAELEMMNGGSGYRISDSRAYMKKPVVMGEEGPKGNRARLNHEVVIKDREDGLNYAPVLQNGPSSNTYVHKSRVLKNSLGQIDIVWENADEELIYPGMPCRYSYLSQGQAVSVTGTVLFVHGLTTRVGKLDAQAYRTTLHISLAVEPFSHVPDINYTGTKGEINRDFKTR